MINFFLALISSGAVSIGYIYPLAFLYIVLIRQTIKYRILKVDFVNSASFIFLVLFSLSYVIIGERTLKSFFYFAILLIMAYIIGWTAVRMSEKAEEDIINYIIAIMIGFCIYVTLNFMINGGNNRYTLIDFWSGDIRVATGSGMLNTLIMSSLFYIIKLEKRLWLKLLLAALAVISIMYMFLLGSRTQFIIALICLFVCMLLHSIEINSISGFVKNIVIIIVLALMVFIIYYFNLFGLKDFVLSSNLLNRMNDAHSIANADEFRFDSFFMGISDLFMYPFGGRRSQMYRHNMWLDVGRVAGIFPSIFLVAYTIITAMSAYKLFINKSLKTKSRYLILSVYIGVNINCFFEPVIEGFANFFFTFCIINGMTDALLRIKTNERLNARIE